MRVCSVIGNLDLFEAFVKIDGSRKSNLYLLSCIRANRVLSDQLI